MWEAHEQNEMHAYKSLSLYVRVCMKVSMCKFKCVCLCMYAVTGKYACMCMYDDNHHTVQTGKTGT